MTIQNNVHFLLTYNIGGNVWMKDGSGMQAPWFDKGNADGGQFAAEYADNLVDLINDIRADFGIPDLPFIAVESLSSRTPGEQFVKGVATVNAQQKNTQAAAIAARSEIDLLSDKYKPYNAAGDTTHWRHNSRAFLDVGYWAADLMIPMIRTEANHAEDAKVQQTWRDVLPQMRDPELEEKRRQILESRKTER